MSIPFTWLYLIYDPFTDLWKIGRSDDPQKRLEDLKRVSTILAAPTEGYRLVEAWLCPQELESHFHNVFADQRVRGEWFEFYLPNDRLHISGELSCYQRWTHEASRSHELYVRYLAYTQEYAGQIRDLTAERDSLLRQRSYLVQQRNALPTFQNEEVTTF
jgi:hypothetical protein